MQVDQTRYLKHLCAPTIDFCTNSLMTFSRSTLMSLSHHIPFNGPNGPPVGLDVTNLVTQATSTRGGLAQLPSTEGSGTAQAQTSNTKTATPKYAQVSIGIHNLTNAQLNKPSFMGPKGSEQ